MPKFVLAKWKGEGPYWFRHETAGVMTLADCPSIGAFLSALDVQFEAEAENVEEARIKFEVGAVKFEFVHKGKCIYDLSLTAGDRNAVRRTTDLILKQLSDEAVKFLVTAAGCIPSDKPLVVREQLWHLIMGTAA